MDWRYLWGKTDQKQKWRDAKIADFSWHPLFCHMLDVAAVAEELLTREPIQTRRRLAASSVRNTKLAYVLI